MKIMAHPNCSGAAARCRRRRSRRSSSTPTAARPSGRHTDGERAAAAHDGRGEAKSARAVAADHTEQEGVLRLRWTLHVRKRRRLGDSPRKTDEDEARLFEEGIVAETSGQNVGWNMEGGGGNVAPSRGPTLREGRGGCSVSGGSWSRAKQALL